MFAKGSRYRKLPEVVLAGADGRARRAVEPRPLPPTAGVLLHTLAEGERLDTIANAYYRQPRKWWQICDANPEFLSPLALLGLEPLASVRFPLAPAPLCTLMPALRPSSEQSAKITRALWEALCSAELYPASAVGAPDAMLDTIMTEVVTGRQWRIAAPRGVDYVIVDHTDMLSVYTTLLPWNELLRALTSRAGVEDVQIEETWLAFRQPSFLSPLVETEQYDRAVIVIFNQLAISVDELKEAIKGVRGLEHGRPQLSERAGKQIAIPADLPA